MNRRPVESTPLIGQAPVFLAMLEHVSRAARLVKPVLVVGERGTGKELITSRLHFLSARWEQPLVKVNCAALTETLLETEIFGHEAGAFTGATRSHAGRFEQAEGGTLVLDEIGTTSSRMQEKILRVIEYGEFQRVGGRETLTADVRIVASTNEDLKALAESGKFRPDLLDRLAFDVIHLPPLRVRREDVEPLATHFAIAVTSELKREVFAGFNAEALAALEAHPWPGNVRELKNAVERSVYRAEDPAAPIETILFDPFASPYAPAARPPPAEPALHRGSGDVSLPKQGFREAVAEYERALLEAALARARYKQTAAADLLGLSYHQFRGLLKKHKVSPARAAD